MYQEGASDTFTHDGREYSLNKLLILTNNLPVKEILVNELIWIFEFTNKFVKGELVCNGCKGGVGGWHEKRVVNSDLSTPIIVTNHHGRLVVLDGIHRLEKARRLNLKNIFARIVVESKLQECL